MPLGTVPFGSFVNLFNYLKGAWVPPLCFRSFEQLFPEWGEKRENLVYSRMAVAGLLHEVDVGLLVKERGGAFRALGLLGACDWGVDS